MKSGLIENHRASLRWCCRKPGWTAPCSRRGLKAHSGPRAASFWTINVFLQYLPQARVSPHKWIRTQEPTYNTVPLRSCHFLWLRNIFSPLRKFMNIALSTEKWNLFKNKYLIQVYQNCSWQKAKFASVSKYVVEQTPNPLGAVLCQPGRATQRTCSRPSYPPNAVCLVCVVQGVASASPLYSRILSVVSCPWLVVLLVRGAESERTYVAIWWCHS